MNRSCTIYKILILILPVFHLSFSYAQSTVADTQLNKTTVKHHDYGANDTVLVPAMMVQGEWLGGRYLSDIFIWGGNPKDLAKYKEKWSRLKRAVYLTYPYARSAGVVMSDVLKHLEKIERKSDRRKYIRSREQELRKAFGDQITELSIYQGKVLMKLINRQTGNDCYEIIKEMKGGVTARFYQTIMFFVGSNLKQQWNPVYDQNDQIIESYVKEIESVYAPSASLR